MVILYSIPGFVICNSVVPCYKINYSHVGTMVDYWSDYWIF